MTISIQDMRRPVRRRLKRVIQQSPDANYRRRANAMLLLYVGYTKSEAARLLHVARTTLDDWIDRYNRYGEAGLVPAPPGSPERTVNEVVCAQLMQSVRWFMNHCAPFPGNNVAVLKT